MPFVIILLSLLFMLLSKRELGTYINHYFLFNIWWMFLALVVQFLETGLYPVSLETYMILIMGHISFNVSMFFTRIKINKLNISVENVKLNLVLYNILQLITTVFLFPYSIRGLAISQEETMATLKAGLNELFDNSPLEVIKVYWFCEPMVISSIIVSCFLFFFVKKRGWTVLFTVINVLLFSIAFGGRIQMFRMCLILLTFIFFKSIIKGDKKLVTKRIKQSFVFIASLAVLMSIFTRERVGVNSKLDFQSTFSVYFVGSFTLLDRYLYDTNTSRIDNEYLCGRATLGTFIDPFILLGSKTGFTDAKTGDMAVNIINKVNEQFYSVGKNVQMNAFSTMYYPFMRDFGILGVLAIPFIFGCCINWVLYKLKQTNSVYLFMVYVMLCYIMLFASNRWEMLNFWPFGAMFYMYFIFRKANIKVYISPKMKEPVLSGLPIRE